MTTRIDPLGDVISFTHDELGRVTCKDAAGRTTSYAYDPAGRLLRASGPDGDLIRQYDRRGLIKTELIDGHATTIRYNAVGRRVGRATPTGHVTTYTHDTAGRPGLLTTGGQEVTFTHDAAGRELSRVFGSLTVTSAWDEAGRLSAEHLITDGRVLNSRTYTYRADGHLSVVYDRLSGTRTFGLDPVGRVTAVTADDWSERRTAPPCASRSRRRRTSPITWRSHGTTAA
ncbi:YD repeat-containing protein [Streptomyces luteogriseus]|uniref:YD repeat-containing protein n=1 Tax=Streptomyces luteogriseus TaxID=68233 RepID=A0A7W7DKC0_9ACTN|nr:YD repeat-containing protein [Streptomyces luteogriseus]